MRTLGVVIAALNIYDLAERLQDFISANVFTIRNHKPFYCVHFAMTHQDRVTEGGKTTDGPMSKSIEHGGSTNKNGF